MIRGMDSSLSALNAYQTKLDKTAENLANVQTDGYKAQRVAMTDNGFGGVAAQVQKDSSPGPLAARGEGTQASVVEKSNVDVAVEMTDLIATKNGFQANLKALQAADEMVGALLDIRK